MNPLLNSVRPTRSAHQQPVPTDAALDGSLDSQPARAVPLRPPVAVILSRFPSVTETFILREVLEMERQGQPVRLVPLLREDPPVVHTEARPWIERALYTPFVSLSILASNVRAAIRHPLRYSGLLTSLVLSSLARPRYLAGTLAIFPKSVHLARVLDREGIRHVHAQFGTHPATAAVVIATFSRAEYSITLHAHDLFVPRYRPFLGEKLRRAAFVRVISAFNRATIGSLFPQVPLDRVKVIHVGIEPENYGSDKGESQDPTGGVERAPADEILTVASLRDYKGIPVLVEASRILRDRGVGVRAMVVGEGPMRAELEGLIAREGLQDVVLLPGARTQEQVAALLAKRPMFVLPSVILSDGWMEGIPVALMEAMAARCPVVASSLSGIPELIEDGESGLLVEPGDPVALADAIERLRDDSSLRDRLGKNGRTKVLSDFDLRRCTRELLQAMDPHNPAVDQVPTLLAQDSIGRPGLEASHVGRDARVRTILIPGSPSPSRVVVKEHLHRKGQSAAPSDRARHEYDVLERLSQAGRGEGELSVPRPMELHPDQGLLTMEACSGQRLDLLLREARWRPGSAAWERALRGMEQAGESLRALQERTAHEGSLAEAMAEWFDRLEEDLDRSRVHLGAGLHLLCQVRLESVRAAFDPTELDPRDVVGRHGDYWPGNVLVGAQGCTILDFEGFGPGLWGEDAAYFLTQAGQFLDYPGLRGRLGALERAFLRGFGPRPGGRELRTDPAWSLFRLAALLKVLAHSEFDGGFRSRRRRRAIQRSIRELVR